MIEQSLLGYDVKFRCDTCDITDNFFTSFEHMIEPYRQKHEGHNRTVVIKVRFAQ